MNLRNLRLNLKIIISAQNSFQGAVMMWESPGRINNFNDLVLKRLIIII